LTQSPARCHSQRQRLAQGGVSQIGERAVDECAAQVVALSGSRHVERAGDAPVFGLQAQQRGIGDSACRVCRQRRNLQGGRGQRHQLASLVGRHGRRVGHLLRGGAGRSLGAGQPRGDRSMAVQDRRQRR
jgi:hypothetical protein